MRIDPPFCPGPSLSRQGKNSGEEMRKKVLDTLAETDYDTIIEINLDNNCGMTGGYVEEAFGKLIHHHGIAYLSRRIVFKSFEEPEYLHWIYNYWTGV